MSELFAAFGLNWKLLLIQALNFGALLAILSYLLYKPIFKMITERQEKIAEGVRTAEQAAHKLVEATGKSEDIVGTAVREAEKLVSDARTHAEERGDEIVKTAEAKAAAALKDAQMKAEEAKRQALEGSEREIARAAMLAAEKILKEKSA
jgi:F-type H+-transporting ATPase subunit b